MSRRRIAAVLACCGALLATPHALPAQAAPADRAAAPRAAVSHPLIQGVVVDQKGKPVDDVEVTAIKADGTVQGSALTYASDREDGPQHGYFFVEVTQGTYTLELSRDGYKTVEYEAGTITKRHRKISLGELEITRLAAPTTTKAALEAGTVSPKQRGVVDVKVTTRKGRAVGDVEVREGRRVVGSDSLRKSDKGALAITLAKLPKGDHHLVVYYLGSNGLKPSHSSGLTLHVVKKRR